jgi:hypothetical protein
MSRQAMLNLKNVSSAMVNSLIFGITPVNAKLKESTNAYLPFDLWPGKKATIWG